MYVSSEALSRFRRDIAISHPDSPWHELAKARAKRGHGFILKNPDLSSADFALGLGGPDASAKVWRKAVSPAAIVALFERERFEERRRDLIAMKRGGYGAMLAGDAKMSREEAIEALRAEGMRV